MRRQHRSRALAAGLIGLLLFFLVLTGCIGRRDAVLPGTAAVPTITPTVEGSDSATTAPVAAATSVLPTPASTSIEPRIGISPTNGPVGTQFRVLAAGFRPDTLVILGLGYHGGQVVTSTTARSDGEGQIVRYMVIPDSAQAGDRWLVVAQVAGQPIQAVSNLFEVTEPLGAQSVQVEPRSAGAGMQLRVTGGGFPSEARVEIGLGLSGAEPTRLATVQSHADGRVEAIVEVPDAIAPGTDWVVTVATSDQAFKAVSDPMEILAPPEVTATVPLTPTAPSTATAEPAATALPTVTSPPAAPTTAPPPTAPATAVTGPSVLIYMIALEDAGGTGAEIGCGDSVVPVAVAIRPTMGVLRAAMEALLAQKDPYYGESGFYNALYRSDLSVGIINLAAGRATVNLSGSLLLGGACDAPRVKAQLELTALQFSTVREVMITVNGQPLDTVLSEQ